MNFMEYQISTFAEITNLGSLKWTLKLILSSTLRLLHVFENVYNVWH